MGSKKCLVRTIVGLLLLAEFTVSTPIYADSEVQGVPTAWRLQDYLDGTIAVYYTGASCTNGLIVLSASAPADSKNRLWSLIMTGKAANRPVGIFYNSTTCVITSFYFKEQ